MQSKQIFQALKQRLKNHRLNYRDVAKELGLSEVSIKKMFSAEKISLERLERIANLMDLSLLDIIKSIEDEAEEIKLLDLRQEKALMNNNKLFVVLQLLLRSWSENEILKEYSFSKEELTGAFVKLDKLSIIKLLPNNRVKLLVSKNLEWRKDGPIVEAFERFVQKEFFKYEFNGHSDSHYFLSKELSMESFRILQRKMEKMVQEINEASEIDNRLDKSQISTYAFIVGARPWIFPLVAKYKKIP